jgi:hypothetical protein
MAENNWKFSFDTSAFIDSWRRYYPKDVFPSLWLFINELIQNGVIISNYIVKQELDYQEDDLAEFCNQFKEIFILPDVHIQEYVSSLLIHPDLEQWRTSGNHIADPFVVALGKVYNLSVVSYENDRKTKNSIPVACKILGVPHLSFLEFLRKENFTV